MMRMVKSAGASSMLVVCLMAAAAFAHDAPAPPSGSSPTTQIDQSARAYFNQGEDYAKKKDWDQAITAYQQAVRIDPKFAEAWNNLGYCYRKVKQYDKALDAYKQAIGLKPDFTYPHEYLARTYLAMGDKDAAMREYEILKRLDAKMADQLLKAIQANNADLGEDD